MAAVLFSCGSKSDGFSINGNITGDLEEGTQVFLKKFVLNSQPVDVDTTTVTAGKFVFEGPATATPEMYYIAIDKIRGFIPIVVENGTIEVSTQKDSLMFAKIEGTEQNEIFANYMDKSRSLSDRVKSIQEDARKASTARDSVTMNSLQEEYREIQEEAKKFELDFIKENPNALISVFLLDRALGARALPEAEIKELFDALSPEIKETAVGKSIQEKLAKSTATAVGSKAPNFSAPTPSGEKLALNDVLGKVTIVDFWAGWCKPCRAENPNLVNIYNKYNSKGLSILGVSLDKSADEWKKAIEDDKLVWHQVSNVQYFDEIAKLYNVNAIPSSFILDEKGVIVAKNLRGEALEQKIAELLP